jgi:hypothetical protein
MSRKKVVNLAMPDDCKERVSNIEEQTPTTNFWVIQMKTLFLRSGECTKLQKSLKNLPLYTNFGPKSKISESLSFIQTGRNPLTLLFLKKLISFGNEEEGLIVTEKIPNYHY